MAADVASSLSCSTLRSQEDPSPTSRPAIRSLKTSRRDEICEGFDSLSGLLSDLRSAQDDAQQEVSRALQERDLLLCCLQSKEGLQSNDNDDRIQDFMSQLTMAESRCSNLHDQLDLMKKTYASGERAGCGQKRRQKPCRARRRTHCTETSPSPGPALCAGSVANRVQQYIVQRRRSLSCSTRPGASRSPTRPCANASSPSLRGAGPGRCRSRSPAVRSCKPSVRVRAQSLLNKTGGRRDCGDETDADGDQLWGGAGRKTRCPGAILANASKYMPGSDRPPPARGRAKSLAARGARPGRPCRRAASESVSRHCGRDSGIDSESDSPSRATRRAPPRGRASCAKQVNRAPLPFLSSSSTSRSHHIGANIQQVMNMSRQAACAARVAAPLPEIKVGRLPQRGPFLRYHRRKPFKYNDKTEIDKYKILLEPRSCGPDNTADYASYQREGEEAEQASTFGQRTGCGSTPAKSCAGEDARSAASAHVQRMLCSPAALRNTRHSLKQLLEDLAEEFAGLECVCQQLETDMDGAAGALDRGRLEEQITRLEQMMEERRRQVCCLLKLYKQIKKLSRGMGGGGDGGRPSRHRGGRGLTCRKPLRVNTRIQPSSVRPRGVSFSMQKSFPMRPVVPRQPCEPRRPRNVFSQSADRPMFWTQRKVLRDMRNIQRHMRMELGEEY